MIKAVESTSSGDVLTLKVALKGSKPLIWRRLQILSDATLGDLHEAIQCVMPWYNCHLHEFLVGDKHYGVPHPEYFEPMLDEQDVLLGDVFRQDGDNITYVYDFGDGWQHSVVREGLSPSEPGVVQYPVCLDGANACPPEDSGSLYGYYEKLRITNDPKDPQYDDICAWMPPDFDPTEFSTDEANVMLMVGCFTEEDFDALDDDSEQAAATPHDILAESCGWCREYIPDDTPVLSQMLKAPEGVDLSDSEGEFLLLPVGGDERPVAAYVVPSDSDAKKDGYDYAIILCSEKCGKELREALTETFGEPLD